jgi:hypothetical protein
LELPLEGCWRIRNNMKLTLCRKGLVNGKIKAEHLAALFD